MDVKNYVTYCMSGDAQIFEFGNMKYNTCSKALIQMMFYSNQKHIHL